MNVNDVCDFINNPYWIKESWGNQILNPLGKLILRKADSIRVDNHQEYNKLTGLKIHLKKIWNIPFILNEAEQFTNSKPDPEFRKGLLGGKFDHLILFVGRFEDQKDLPTLFRTARKVIQSKPRTLFLIIGDGKKGDELQTMAKSLEIEDHLFFTGWVDYFDLPKYYAACEAFILTSRYETSPRVLIFACLCRKPIVTTEVSGVSDLVEQGENGFIVSVGDVEGLSRGVLRLLENPEKAQEMGEVGFNKVKELLDEEKILNQYQKMYQFTLDQGSLSK
jgi:glycosyltransferase involved in cell wall biosynthesis